MEIKQKFTKSTITTTDDIKNRYWLKAELAQFCKMHGLSTVGSKQELLKRIEAFIVDGYKIKPKITSLVTRDSHQPIKMDTPVRNYKNDAATRQFFMSHIGQHFHFNAYLRQFTDQKNIMPGLTYGDLVAGWLVEEEKKDNSQYKTYIAKQFEYNQFVRDYFANERGKSHADMVRAWKILKTLSGAKTYINYQSTLKREKGS